MEIIMDEIKTEAIKEVVAETEVAADTVEEALELKESANGAEETLDDFEIKKRKKKKIAAVLDKITTGIFIFLMASPILILAYIFLWFIYK